MRSLLGVLTGLMLCAGCSSGGDSSGLTSGRGASGGQYTGGTGGIGGGSGGGSGGAVDTPNLELVHQADCHVFRWFGVYDSQSIYYSCQGDPAPYTTVPEWTLYRVPLGGTAQALTSAPNPLWVVTADEQALYSNFSSDFEFDPIVNTWDISVRRVPLAAPALNEFAPEMGANDDPVFLAQTPGFLFLVHEYSTVTRHPKPSGGLQSVTSGGRASITAGWTDGTVVGWVAKTTPPKAFQTPVGGGAIQEGLEFPETCANFFHDDAKGGWLATCAKVEGASMLDILAFDSAGTMTVIADSVFPFASWYLWHKYLGRLYWQEGQTNDETSQVVLMDAAGQLSRIPLGKGEPINVVDEYVYFQIGDALWRVAVSEATPDTPG